MREKRKLFSNLWDLPYGSTTPYNLFDTTKNSKEFVQKLQLQRKIPVHDGCVNSICWNETGKYLLSGSDDQRLSIVHGYDYSVLAYIPTGHKANIFSAKFLPNTDDKNVVSCSGDGIIIYSNVERADTSLKNKFTCHKGTAYEVMTVPNDPNTFLSCGEDKTVRWFDVRTKTSCRKEECQEDILIHCQSPVTSLAINPYTPYQLAVGCADASVRMFDRRMLCTQNASGFKSSNGFEALMACFTVPEFTQSRRITSLSYSADGQEMLVSYSSDYIYLFDIRDDLNKKPRHLSFDGSLAEADSDTGLYFRGRPLMKRLRIRGDWSDTGPNARPEAEARAEGEEPAAPRTTIVRTMTDILTRMLHTTQTRAADPPVVQPTPEPPQVSPQPEPRVLDTNEEEASCSPIKKTDGPTENLTEYECFDDQYNPSASQPDTLSQPSTSAITSVPCPSGSNEKNDEKDNLGKSPTEPSPHNVNKKEETNEASSTDTDTSSTDNIKREIESRRRDLIERHHTEPMVNLHYSGQSVSSGQITMEVATSSTANERQWLEQSIPLPSLLPGVPEVANNPSPHQAQQRSQTLSPSDYAIETMGLLQHSMHTPQTTPEEPHHSIRSETESSSSSAQTHMSGQVASDGVELMMEVDSWEDSEEELRSRMAEERESDEAERASPTFMDSLNDEVKAANEQLRKAEARLSSVRQPRVKRKYTGHRNARTMIKESTFWGDNFIMSGSDCGHIFIWDRHTAELVMLMEADHHVVNCLQPHPFDPILASSGIDYDIKLWTPSREEPFFDVEKANEIIKRNEIMLEETKDTITVPASFMFRMFTTLNHFRTGRAYRWSRAAREMRAANSNSDASER